MSDPLTGSVEFSLICQTAIQQLVCLKLDRKKIEKKIFFLKKQSMWSQLNNDKATAQH